MPGQYDQLISSLREIATPKKAKASAWFFKTGPGQYAEGDKFLGVTVPEQRKIGKKFKDLPPADLEKLITSSWHEERLTGLIILVDQFKHATPAGQKKIYEFYLSHTNFVNNWDLVDSSAEHIVGAYLEDKNRGILDKLAISKSVWERRIAMLATFHYIKKGHAEDALRIAQILVNDSHDLIQKATGWMLREIGKRVDQHLLKLFLDKHALMPRTTLRYAIEHLPEDERLLYLNKGKKWMK